MKIQFMGAAQTVTGSCFIIEACGVRFAVDCGMHQGNSAIEERNFDTKNYRAGDIDFILLTHAHIDHSGLLPRIVAEGFKGPIYCTAPTADLATLMLEDSAHIQETEAAWKAKKEKRRNGAASEQKEDVAPLYTVDDARKVAELWRPEAYGKMFEPHPGIQVTYRDAAHILGSGFLEILIDENGKKLSVVFSGDLGRPETLLLPDPSIPQIRPDYLFLESTYGDRNHKNEGMSLDELAEAIEYSRKNGGKVIIPAFAVGRTQELLYSLLLLLHQGRLPEDMPIFVDSPLAIRATEIFRKYKELLDTPELQEFGGAHRLLPNLHFLLEASESQALNTLKGPAIIISASGMCNAGRIKHHLRHHLWDPASCIVFVGYQAIGTPGRHIVDGAKSLRLFNEDIAIKARIFTIGGFSAHAGQTQLLKWVEDIAADNSKMQVLLVHGESQAQETLANLIREKYGLKVSIPKYLEELELTASGETRSVRVTEAPKLPEVDWSFLLDETEYKLNQLKKKVQNAGSASWEVQAELRDRIVELNREILSILSAKL
ncbi:MAG: MBL fold metallo-hydrolase [Desulfovibrionaceae bacterium]|nr:MBL fold metallo-hydrolase [Desulfovibrionaceae bacterium]